MAGPVTIRWTTRADLSVAQAAYTVATGARCVDPKIEQLLLESVTAINTRLISSEIDVREFWRRYRSEVCIADDGPKACAAALLAAGCSEFQVDQTAKAIGSQLSEGRIEFNRRFPKLGEQLALRARPLKTHWDAMGAGLLNEVQRQVWDSQPPKSWWPARVDGLLVQPIRGGDGDYHSAAGRFWIEAMLTDADPAVPEVLRVAYLVTRLAIDQHRGAADPALSNAWSLATVPLVLAAGAELGIVAGPPIPVQTANTLWLFTGEADPVAETVQQWWQQSRDAQTPLPIAVKQLDTRLRETSERGDQDEAEA